MGYRTTPGAVTIAGYPGISVVPALQVPVPLPPNPGTQFDPVSIFHPGVSGCFYNVSRRSSLFQDTQGKNWITNWGQRVGLIKDLSGHGLDLVLTQGPGAVYIRDEYGYPCLYSYGDSMYSAGDASLPMNSDPYYLAVACSYSAFSQNSTVINYGDTTQVNGMRGVGLDNSRPYCLCTNFHTRLISGVPPISGDVYILQSSAIPNGLNTTIELLVNGQSQGAIPSTTLKTVSGALTLFGAAAPASLMMGRIYSAIIYGGSAWPQQQITQWMASQAGRLLPENDLLLMLRPAFARNSIGTWFDPQGILQTADANLPRMENDMTTGEPRGLLIEEERTNLITHSNLPSIVDWKPQNMSEINGAEIGPDGTQSASHNRTETFEQNLPHLYPLSCYLPQPPETLPDWVSVRTWVKLGNYSQGGSTWDTSGHSKCGSQPGDSGKIAIKAKILHGPGSINVTDDFYTITNLNYDDWTCFETNTTEPLQVFPGYILTVHNRDDLHNGVVGDYLTYFGQQYEFAPFSSSFIPTGAQAESRAADDAVIDASWIPTDAICLYGTFRIDNLPDPSGGTATVVALTYTDSPTQNYLQINVDDLGSLVMSGRINNATYSQIRLPAGTVVAGADVVFAAAFDSAQFRLAVNGAMVGQAAQIKALPTDPRQFIVGSALGQFYLNGTIRRLAYLPESPDDATLQALAQ